MRYAARTYLDPVQTAVEVLRRSGMPRMSNGVAFDVKAILQNYGKFDVATVPNLTVNGKRLLGMFVPDFNVVMVEQHCLLARARFTLAHELGHAELEHHFGTSSGLFAQVNRSAFNCTPNDADVGGVDERAAGARRRREIRANRFAATLLMPADLVRELWRQHRDDECVADLLMVSREALAYRLAEIRLR